MLISNFSQAWAMYCLVLLYHEFQVKLKPHKPLKKFICVKAIVFFSFWQQVFIAMLVHFHVIDDEWQGQRLTTYNTDEVADGLQNLVICFEMFLFAIAHRYSFSYREYRAMMRAAARSSGGLATPQKPFMRAFIDSSVPETVSTTLNIGATAVTDGVKTVGGAVVGGWKQLCTLLDFPKLKLCNRHMYHFHVSKSKTRTFPFSGGEGVQSRGKKSYQN